MTDNELVRENALRQLRAASGCLKDTASDIKRLEERFDAVCYSDAPDAKELALYVQDAITCIVSMIPNTRLGLLAKCVGELMELEDK